MVGSHIAKRAIARAFRALNDRDIEAFIKDWRDDATFVYPGKIPVSGTHAGREAIRSWFEHMIEQYPRIAFSLKNVAVANLLDVVGTNVVIVEWDLELTNRDGYFAENSGITVIQTRRGKGFYVKDYIFDTGEVWRTAWGFS